MKLSNGVEKYEIEMGQNYSFFLFLTVQLMTNQD